jgi:hypothetical protein
MNVDETTDVEWCLICDARPAEGTLRRVFADSHAPVVSNLAAPTVRVCQECADKHHATPAPKASTGRPALWEFTLTDPVCDEDDPTM